MTTALDSILQLLRVLPMEADGRAKCDALIAAALEERRELVECLRQLDSAVVGYAQAHGWTELSEPIIAAHAKAEALLAKHHP